MSLDLKLLKKIKQLGWIEFKRMDRFKWSNGKLDVKDEEMVHEQAAVSIYNFDDKTTFNIGKLRLTSHRLFWLHKDDPFCIIELKLSLILSIQLKQVQQMGISNRAASATNRQLYPRILLNLDKIDKTNELSIIDPSLKRSEDGPFVQFEFEFGGHNEFYNELNQQIMRKRWSLSASSSSASSSENKMHNVGIVGIQRKIQDRLDNQDQKIQNSFKDLNILMNQAKDMVNLSNTLIAKLSKDKPTTTNENEDDEDMKKLKGYFLNMGIIDNPVTKETSGSKYYKDLALEINNNLIGTIIDQGGIMTLADVYCRLNRARAIAGLISPEDLFNACKQINKLNLKLKYNFYADLNLHVLEVETSLLNNNKLEQICGLVEKNECLTPYALGKLLNCSLIVAKKQLLDCERLGKLCRDDTHLGLRFYINLFLVN